VREGAKIEDLREGAFFRTGPHVGAKISRGGVTKATNGTLRGGIRNNCVLFK
jgi:hypothetical protein